MSKDSITIPKDEYEYLLEQLERIRTLEAKLPRLSNEYKRQLKETARKRLNEHFKESEE